MKKSFFLRPLPYVIVGTVVLAFLIFQGAIAPYLVRVAMNRLITKPCRHCSLTVEAVEVKWWGPGITLNRIKFMVSAGTNTTISADVPAITLFMYPLALFKKRLHLGAIEVIHPAVSVVERKFDIHEPTKDDPESSADGPITSLEVDGIVVKQGDFNYALDANRQEGIVRVHEIDAHVQRFGTTEDLRNHKFHGSATGLLEKSGRFELSAAANFFTPEPDVDVELHLANQRLEDLNAYFHPADQVKLEGTLVDGHTTVAIRGVNANSKVSATFKDLKFTVEKNEARGTFESFLLNLFGALKMGEHNLYDSAQERTKTASLVREPDQTVLALILHSMKAAALKIPSREE